jgi:NADPH-dependent 2,4-dienoyl-CoA reductase/sulfur reductase-like enzyme
MADVQTYKLGDWKLQSGESIPDAHLAYKTFGDPNSPAIIYPSWFSGCMIPLAVMYCPSAKTYLKLLPTMNGS